MRNPVYLHNPKRQTDMER